MRQQFVRCNRRSEAVAQCPWAAIIVKAGNGYMAFESVDDYRTWIRQR